MKGGRWDQKGTVRSHFTGILHAVSNRGHVNFFNDPSGNGFLAKLGRNKDIAF